MTDEPIQEEDKPLSRRAFIGAAAGGIGVIAAGALVAGICGDGAPEEQPDDPENASTETASDAGGQVGASSPARLGSILPASAVAQSILIALAPESVAALVTDVASNEQAAGLMEDGTSRSASLADEASAEAFVSSVTRIAPEAIFDAGYYDDDHAQLLARIQEATQVPFALVNLNDHSFSEAMSIAADAFGIDGADVKIAEVAKAESICEKAANTPADERFVVHVAGGTEATRAYGKDTAMRRMLLNAAADAYPVTNEQLGTYTVQDDSCFRSDLTPDVVLFASRSASADYLAEGTRTMQWEVPAAGRFNRVLPGLVSGFAWLEGMSDFALMTIGAAWVAQLLYPVRCGKRENLASGFYQTLYGQSLKADELAEECEAAIEAANITTKQALDAEVAAWQDEQAQMAQSLFDAMDKANEPTQEEIDHAIEAAREYAEQQRQWRENPYGGE